MPVSGHFVLAGKVVVAAAGRGAIASMVEAMPTCSGSRIAISVIKAARKQCGFMATPNSLLVRVVTTK